MTFSLDRTVAYVKISEPDLISIHRSTHPIVPSDNCSHGHLCDAFICLTRENGTNRVWVALHDIRHKSNLVFVADSEAADNREHSHFVMEAVSFLTGLGFTMEPVNLGFSPAMREVIMRDLKITRPPKNYTAKRQTQPPTAASLPVEAVQPAETQQTANENQPPQVITAEEPVSLTGEGVADREAELNARLAEAVAAMARLEAEKEELFNRGKKDIKALKAELARSRRGFDTAEAARIEAEKALSTSAAANNDGVAAWETERVALLSELAVAREEASALREELMERQAVRDAEYEEMCREVESLRSERAEATVAVSRESDALKAALEAADDELSVLRARNESAGRELESLQVSLAAAEEALCAERNRNESALREVETLRAALAISDEALSIERTKNESALREMDALECNAAAELKVLQKKIDDLAAEKRLLITKAEEMKDKAKGEIERLRQENQSQRRAALKKLNSLKEELSQLAETRALMTSPFGLPLLQGDAPDSQDAEDAAEMPVSEAVLTGSEGALASPFGSCGRGDDMSFEPAPAMKGVPYASPEDLVELQRSFNKIQAAPVGNLVQSCEGFVCLVKNDGKKMVYVVWLMNETGELLVCRPDRAPENVKAARQAFREGIGYFERVGFLMDRLELDADPERRQRQLDKLPIFDRIVTECAA